MTDKTTNTFEPNITSKWPRMLVTGKSVTPEQAEDIILRTDRFLTSSSEYAGGNNHEFNEWYHKKIGLPAFGDDYASRCLWEDDLRDKIGFIHTQYVKNNWASCAFIGGPHGWCQPDGKIEFFDNVGKWPCAEDLIEDWQKLAAAFPYLDLHVCFVEDEGQGEPAFNIRVKDGKALTQEPDTSRFPKRNRRGIYNGSEQGIPHDMLERIIKRIKEALNQ